MKSRNLMNWSSRIDLQNTMKNKYNKMTPGQRIKQLKEQLRRATDDIEREGIFTGYAGHVSVCFCIHLLHFSPIFLCVCHAFFTCGKHGICDFKPCTWSIHTGADKQHEKSVHTSIYEHSLLHKPIGLFQLVAGFRSCWQFSSLFVEPHITVHYATVIWQRALFPQLDFWWSHVSWTGCQHERCDDY